MVDPAADWPLFAEKAPELLTVSKVGVMFGCWTSMSRRSVLPVIKELNGLLFYPVQHDGEEWSTIVRNVLASGAAGKKVGVISTSNSDATIGFHQELAAAGV